MIHDDGTFTNPTWGDEDGVVTCFMDKVDFDYELGGNLAGNVIYPSEESCYHHEGCGLVEVEVRLKRVIEECDFTKGKSYTPAEMREHEKQLKEDPEWAEYQRLRAKYDRRWKHHLELREKRRRERQESQDE